MRKYAFLALLLLFGCKNLTSLVPFEIGNKVDKYHCWPYNVTVYAVENIELGKQFTYFPLEDFCEVMNKEFETLQWIRFEDFENNLLPTLEECDNNNDLFSAIQNKSILYISGCYRVFKGKPNKAIKVYDKIAILDVESELLHVFEYMNYVY